MIRAIVLALLAQDEGSLQVEIRDAFDRPISVPFRVFANGRSVAEGSGTSQALTLKAGSYVVVLSTGAAETVEVPQAAATVASIREPSVFGVPVGDAVVVCPMPDGKRGILPWPPDFFPASAEDPEEVHAELFRRRSMDALFPAEAGGSSIVEFAREIVRSTKDWSKPRWDLFAALVWLGRLGDVPELESVLEKKSHALYARLVIDALLHRHPSSVEERLSKLQGIAPAAALRDRGAPSARRIRDAVRSVADGFESRLAVQILDATEGEEAETLLDDFLRLRAWDVQLQSAAALARRGRLDALRFLVEATQDSHPDSAAVAFDTLARLTPRPEGLLRAMLRQEDDWMRLAAVRALDDLPGFEARFELGDSLQQFGAYSTLAVLFDRLTGYGDMRGAEFFRHHCVTRGEGKSFQGPAALRLVSHGICTDLETAIDFLQNYAASESPSDFLGYLYAVQLGGAMLSPRVDDWDRSDKALMRLARSDRPSIALGARVGLVLKKVREFPNPAIFFDVAEKSFVVVSFGVRIFGRGDTIEVRPVLSHGFHNDDMLGMYINDFKTLLADDGREMVEKVQLDVAGALREIKLGEPISLTEEELGRTILVVSLRFGPALEMDRQKRVLKIPVKPNLETP